MLKGKQNMKMGLLVLENGETRAAAAAKIDPK